MAGISSKAAGEMENKRKYNGIELNEDLGVDEYEAFYRNLDQQIGRWWEIDPKVEGQESMSPYTSMANDPILKSDPMGDEEEPSNGCCGGVWKEIVSAGKETLASLKEAPSYIWDKATEGAREFNTYVNLATPFVELATGKSVGSDFTEDKSRWTSAGEALMVALPAAKAEGLLVKSAETRSVGTSLETRAGEIHSTLSPETQRRTTTAVASATTADGKSVRLVASSEKNLRPAQRAALQPGEIAVSGKGHAEATIVNHANTNGMTVHSVAASRPICSGCATTIQNTGAATASPLKKVPAPN